MILNVFSSASRSLSALLIVAGGSLRSDIEQVRSCFFHLLLACSVIVAVGVVVEGIEHLLSTGKPFVDTETGIFDATPLINWHKKLERLGWLLVILGVVGEGIFEAATTSADNILQDFNNTLLAIATDEAGSAAKSAKTAHDEAHAASAEAGKAQHKADAVGKRAKELDRQLLAAKKTLEVLEAKRKELEKSIAPRPMLVTFGNNIDPLKAFSGINVQLEYAPSEERNAGSLRGVLDASAVGWHITDDKSNPNVLVEGVIIWRHLSPLRYTSGTAEATAEQDEKRSEGAANALADFLHSSGWEDVTVGMGSRAEGPLHVPANTVRIQIGHKPEPYFSPSWENPIDPNKPLKPQIEERLKQIQKEIEKRNLPK
ncbi:MAG: hypothetical protein WCF26_15770 [Candidatus Sulfotelmatobacter sp.]